MGVMLVLADDIRAISRNHSIAAITRVWSYGAFFGGLATSSSFTLIPAARIALPNSR